MPLYDFRCTICGYEFEIFRPMAKSTWPASCPKPECRRLAYNTGVYHCYMKTDTKGPGATWIRNPKESPTAILREDYDPPVESRKDMEKMIKRKGVTPLG